jgi:uncharacterized protein YlxP (DUF503 family)
MVSNENLTDKFLELCKKNTQSIMNIFDTVDIDSLMKIHIMNSDFKKIQQIDSNAYRQAEKILDKKIYETYVYSPKVHSLKNIFINALNKDKDFRKNIYESIIAENKLEKKGQNIKNTQRIPQQYETRIEEIVTNLKERYSVSISREDAIKLLNAELGVNILEEKQKVSKPVKKSKIFTQTTEEMKLYIEKEYNVSISRKEALGVLKSEFGENLKEFIQNESSFRSNKRRKHLVEILKNKENSFFKGNYMKPKNINKKVRFDFTM